MLDIVPRHRPIALLAAVVLAQVLLLAYQIKKDKDVRLIRAWSVELLTPVQRAGTFLIGRVTGAWRGYVGLRQAHRENESLHAELSRLELRNHELESRAAEATRLASLLNFRGAHASAPMLAAEVIGANADAPSRTIFINRGSRDGVRANFAVITPEGVVGKIVEVFSSTAQVLLLTDKDSGVGALLESSRTHGVVKGTGEPEPRMEYVVNDEKVAAGETIVTSGEDRIFPKDLPVGIVASTQAGNPFKIIHVTPAARLDRLEEVLVLLSQKEVETNKDGEEAANSPAGAAPPVAGAAKTQPATVAGSTKPPAIPVKHAPSPVKPTEKKGEGKAAKPQASQPPAEQSPAPQSPAPQSN